MARRLLSALAALVLLAPFACYSPQFGDRFHCGPGGVCPSGFSCGGDRCFRDRWTVRPTTPSSPSARQMSAMAFDGARGKTLLFGGMNERLETLGDTWEWDGTTWSERQSGSPSPAPRADHSIVFDTQRNVAVLVGGQDGTQWFRDAWEWDGASWRDACASPSCAMGAPTPRGAFAMAFDPRRNVTVLFGGQDGSRNFDETWLWDGTAWSRKDLATRPPARTYAAMSFDPMRGTIVLFGGVYTGGEPKGDEWEWDGSAWKEVPASVRPPPRHDHAMVFDEARLAFVLFGGYDGSYFDDTWERADGAWHQVGASFPARRAWHAMAYDSKRQKVVLFGGWDEVRFYGDTWEY